MAKFIEKGLAREMRWRGKSINEIAVKLNVSKGSASKWCQDIFLTKIQKELLDERSKKLAKAGGTRASENRKKERIVRMRKLELKGANKVGRLNTRELFLVGAALYWAEGGKSQRRTVFINSDPRMIRLIIKWFKRCLGIANSRLIARVEINESHKDRQGVIMNHWSKVTNIPTSQFIKTSIKHSQLKKVYQNREEYFGSLQITVSKGTNLNYEILGYIKGLGDDC